MKTISRRSLFVGALAGLATAALPVWAQAIRRTTTRYYKIERTSVQRVVWVKRYTATYDTSVCQVVWQEIEPRPQEPDENTVFEMEVNLPALPIDRINAEIDMVKSVLAEQAVAV